MRIHDCFCHHNHQTIARWKTLERKRILLQQTSKSLTLTFSTSWPVLYFSSFIESVDPSRSFFRFSPSKPLLCVGVPTCQHTSRMAERSTSGSGAALLRLHNVGNSFKLLKWILGWGVVGEMDKSQKSNLSFD